MRARSWVATIAMAAEIDNALEQVIARDQLERLSTSSAPTERDPPIADLYHLLRLLGMMTALSLARLTSREIFATVSAGFSRVPSTPGPSGARPLSSSAARRWHLQY